MSEPTMSSSQMSASPTKVHHQRKCTTNERAPPMSAPPMSAPPMSALPMSALPMSAPPMSAPPMSALPMRVHYQ